MKKLISIVFPTFNERDNLDELSSRVNKIINKINNYKFEVIFIDNSSNDGTIEKIKDLCKKNKNYKAIINARNFGHLKSPYYAILQTDGDATILLASDLQDPPEIIPKLIKKWQQGSDVVLTVKKTSHENKVMFKIRSLYYNLISFISDVTLIKNATGSGLFDKKIISVLKSINDNNPYFRGLLCELTSSIDTVEFDQPRRLSGITKNNFYSLFDLAMLGVTNHSRFPLRIMTLGGFLISLLSLITAISYIFLKIFYWSKYDLGTAPILIGVFFFGAIQAFFIGVLGEYIGSIHIRTRNLPLVVEKERINFR